MSIMDELKKLTRPYDDDGTMVDDEFDDMDTGLDDAAFTRSAAPQSQPAPQPQPQPQPAQPQAASPITMGGMSMGGMSSMGAEPQRSSVSPMGQGYGQSLSKCRVVLVAPTSLDFDKARFAANCFRDGAAVILNCEGLQPEETNRLKDFFTGCVYSLDGTMRRAAQNVFIMVPKGVGLDEDSQDDSEDEA
jgi:FtsZ-interacting cell division protein YlmF